MPITYPSSRAERSSRRWWMAPGAGGVHSACCTMRVESGTPRFHGKRTNKRASRQ